MDDHHLRMLPITGRSVMNMGPTVRQSSKFMCNGVPFLFGTEYRTEMQMFFLEVDYK